MRIRVRPCCALLAGIAFLLPASAVMARQGDRQQPIDVRADRSQFDERAGTQTLIGNVEIVQGSMQVRADRIEISLQDNALSRIEGSGSPIRFEQENDQGETITGEANRIDYDAGSGVLVLSGKARLSQPNQSLESERIVFDADSQKVSAEGSDAGERVTIRIKPPSEAADSAEKP